MIWFLLIAAIAISGGDLTNSTNSTDTTNSTNPTDTVNPANTIENDTFGPNTPDCEDSWDGEDTSGPTYAPNPGDSDDPDDLTTTYVIIAIMVPVSIIICSAIVAAICVRYQEIRADPSTVEYIT